MEYWGTGVLEYWGAGGMREGLVVLLFDIGGATNVANQTRMARRTTSEGGRAVHPESYRGRSHRCQGQTVPRLANSATMRVSAKK
jgi:dienelactone hydrolase